jgi:Zinc knuckle
VYNSIGAREKINVILYDFSNAFGTLYPQLLLRKLKIYGVTEDAISWLLSFLTQRERMLAEEESTLKLETVVNRIYAAERAAVAAKELSEGAAPAEINKVYHKPKMVKGKFVNKGQTKSKVRCYGCNQEGHIKPQCPLKVVKCYACNNPGHIARNCPSGKGGRKGGTHKVDEYEEAVDQERAVNYLLRMEAHLAANKKAFLTIELNKQPLEMEVDSGATFSLIGRQTYNAYYDNDSALQPSNIKMQAWGQLEDIEAIGKVVVDVQLKNDKSVQLDLLVMDQDGPALMGRNWFQALGIEFD